MVFIRAKSQSTRTHGIAWVVCLLIGPIGILFGTPFSSTLEAKEAILKYEGYFEANAGSTDCGFEKRVFGGSRMNKAILEVTGDEYTLRAKDAAGPITLRELGGSYSANPGQK
jgi:hypothetical protein